MSTDFQNSFTVGLSRKFATKLYLNTLPHHKRVATLPFEIYMFKKYDLQAVIEANCYSTLSHSITVLK